MNAQFLNPYADIDIDAKDEFGNALVKRMQTYIERGDYLFIQGLRPGTGTISVVCNSLFKKMVIALKTRGITDISSIEQFEKFVAECMIVSPAEVPVAKMQVKSKKLKEAV